MSDLVERLRADWTRSDGRTYGLMCEAADEIERLRDALEECGANYVSEPGTVMSTAGMLAREFMRRQEIAQRALKDET